MTSRSWNGCVHVALLQHWREENQRGFDMKKFVLTTAALLAGTALAAAQGMNTQAPAGANKTERAAPAPSAQQHAPAEKTAPRAQNGQTQMKETTGQAPKAEADTKAKAGADTGMNAQKNDDKAGAASKAGNQNAQKDMNGKADTKASAQGKASDKNGKASAQTERDNKGATTGQGAAGARAANLSSEQKTKIRTVIREKVKAQPVTNVNFSINVGTVVPRTVHYYPVPAEVVTIYPAWRGYNFILVNEQIVIIDPTSFAIVAILV
jgi:outer membrane biosynthesis protein TonB